MVVLDEELGKSQTGEGLGVEALEEEAAAIPVNLGSQKEHSRKGRLFYFHSSSPASTTSQR